MILTLKVKLIFGLYAESDWEGIFEINAASTCDKLHVSQTETQITCVPIQFVSLG